MTGWRAAGCVALLIGLGAASVARPTAAVRGERLATVLGCRSCHGDDLRGRAQLDDPTIARLYSANLTRAAPGYSDLQLERVIRTGVRPDGSRLWFMAAAPYAALSPRDMADLVAYLRNVTPAGEPWPRIVKGPRFLKAEAAGRVKPESLTLAYDLAHPPVDLGPRLARGRYLARTACAGCHSPSLDGAADARAGDPPGLDVVAAYDLPAFTTLMRKGEALGGREVGVMSEEARKRFAGLSASDVAALHAYLRARAERQPAGTSPSASAPGASASSRSTETTRSSPAVRRM